MHDVDYAQIFVSMLAIVNPLLGIPLFVSVTEQMTSAQRHRAACSTAITVFMVLTTSIIGGEFILGLFGINVMDFSIAGGILVLLMAINMLNARADGGARISADERIEAAQRASVAIVPLGIPLLAGPGAISTAVIVTGMSSTNQHKAILVGLCMIIGLLTYAALRAARGVSRLLGITGMNIVNRIMGLLLSAVAVSFMANGIQRLFPILAMQPAAPVGIVQP
ncbi:MAG: NAAT family transporter [Phycisphaerales bacterium]|nr:NAAT family transporter [Phycisphaerales bacterium]